MIIFSWFPRTVQQISDWLSSKWSANSEARGFIHNNRQLIFLFSFLHQTSILAWLGTLLPMSHSSQVGNLGGSGSENGCFKRVINQNWECGLFWWVKMVVEGHFIHSHFSSIVPSCSNVSGMGSKHQPYSGSHVFSVCLLNSSIHFFWIWFESIHTFWILNRQMVLK